MPDSRYIHSAITLLAALGLLLSCSKEPFSIPESDIPLVFRTEDNWDVGAATKAGTEFAQDAQLGVYADYKADASAAAQEFMVNQLVRNSSSGWYYEPVKYWPSEGSLSFYSYAPYVTVSEESPEIPVTAVPYLIGQQDVVRARQINGKAPGTGLTHTEGPSISMTFEHMLSQFRFLFKAVEDFEQGHQVSQIQVKGEFPWAATLDARSGEWSYGSSPVFFETNEGGEMTSTVTMQSIRQGTWNITPEGSEALFYLIGTDKDKNAINAFEVLLWTDYSEGEPLYFNVEFPEDIEKGGSYLLEFVFDSINDEVNLNLKVVPWTPVPITSTIGGYKLINGRWTVEKWWKEALNSVIGTTPEGNFKYWDWGSDGNLDVENGETGSGGWNYDDWGKYYDHITSGGSAGGDWDYSDWGRYSLDGTTGDDAEGGDWDYDNWNSSGGLDGSTGDESEDGDWNYKDWETDGEGDENSGDLDGTTGDKDEGDWNYGDWETDGDEEGNLDGDTGDVIDGNPEYGDWENGGDQNPDSGDTGENGGKVDYDDWEDGAEEDGTIGEDTGNKDTDLDYGDWDQGTEDSDGNGKDDTTVGEDGETDAPDVNYDDWEEGAEDLDGTIDEDDGQEGGGTGNEGGTTEEENNEGE